MCLQTKTNLSNKLPDCIIEMLKMADAFTQKCINTIRVLSADMVEKANSGHPGQWFRVERLVHRSSCYQQCTFALLWASS